MLTGKCIKNPTAYRLSPTVTSKADNTYCFTLSVKVPAGCTNYCCSKADLKKIEVGTLTGQSGHFPTFRASCRPASKQCAPSCATFVLAYQVAKILQPKKFRRTLSFEPSARLLSFLSFRGSVRPAPRLALHSGRIRPPARQSSHAGHHVGPAARVAVAVDVPRRQ